MYCTLHSTAARQQTWHGIAWFPLVVCSIFFGVLARGANRFNVHLAHLDAGVQKAGLDVHDTSLASGSADVLGYGVSPANAC